MNNVSYIPTHTYLCKYCVHGTIRTMNKGFGFHFNRIEAIVNDYAAPQLCPMCLGKFEVICATQEDVEELNKKADKIYIDTSEEIYPHFFLRKDNDE